MLHNTKNMSFMCKPVNLPISTSEVYRKTEGFETFLKLGSDIPGKPASEFEQRVMIKLQFQVNLGRTHFMQPSLYEKV